MCWSCGCNQLPNPHADMRTITTSTLQDAADQAGTDIPGVIANLTRSLALWSPGAGALKQEAPVSDMSAVRVIKMADERRYTLGLAYPAMKAPGKGMDGYDDFVGPDALEKAAWEWMANHRAIGLFHEAGTTGHATVVESYIYRGPDWVTNSQVDGQPVVIKAGDWMMGAIWDEMGWEMVKKGLIGGWSPEGGARRRIPSADRLAQLRSD